MAPQPFKNWSSGLCDCFENANTCCYGFWCCPCLACTVSERFGESRCLPLCDIVGPAIMAFFGVPMCAAPPAALALRAAIRNRYGIEGSLCRDIVISCFCWWCSWCQMHRELKNCETAPIVVNVHHQNVTNVNVHQPAPVMMAPINPAPMMAAPECPAPGMMVPQYPAPIGPENPAQMMMPPAYQLVETKN
ncbi:protein PLANT CADMIUM RESISTANCE 11-like isoform X1 [Etheostoma cragini]|uniref:protein PLANT CADMIUM RESISTANCE 11-like isoform X1 n=1 Tax=Etheostoma cragini TaxID=417921 RepID=UPI00155E2D9F|nr:protein PLANT CADMIUM RESISTANCE 11-like isoform X1 [Etheostoma cragini]